MPCVWQVCGSIPSLWCFGFEHRTKLQRETFLSHCSSRRLVGHFEILVGWGAGQNAVSSWGGLHSFCFFSSAFHFRLDSATAHPELTVLDHSATWSPNGKGHDPRLRSKDKTRSDYCSHLVTVHCKKEGHKWEWIKEKKRSSGHFGILTTQERVFVFIRSTFYWNMNMNVNPQNTFIQIIQNIFSWYFTVGIVEHGR